ncbi:MAG: ATP-binding cassette domain-containing protein [bacterium]|jgi:phospholipid/cholesterol/gamma-HCH transport system ATP-binding protein|nr:MAG: ABC transporter ATP-binding protein [bacterium]
MIEFRGVYKQLGGEPILRGIDLTVPEGQTLALLGPSGAGKSVLLKHAIGLLRPDAGDVLVDGVSVVNASPSELKRVRRRVGYVFQNAALFDSLTVAENLWLAQDDGTGRRSLRECREEAAELLRRVNLDPSVLDMYPAQLSGGMRKRVGVARAIASQPRYLLYDEPTTGLDPVNAETIDSLILELDRELGVTSIVVTHDLESAFTVAERIALLYDGKIRVVATPEELLASTDPVVQRFIRRGRINSPVSV